MLNADQVLDYLRNGGDIYQSRGFMDPTETNHPWVMEGGLRVPESIVRDLRRRGQIAISESVAYRYLRPIDTQTLCRCMESGSDSNQ
jgi:hypothetical protein